MVKMVPARKTACLCLLAFTWVMPVSAQTCDPSPASGKKIELQSAVSEEHAQPIPTLDPFKSPPDRGSRPRALTLSQALKVAESHNTDIEVAERQQKEAFWACKSAAALPGLELGINYLNGNNVAASSSGQLPDTFLSLTQSFGPLGSRSLSLQVANQGYEKARANVAQVRLTVEQSVKDAFFALLAAQEQLKLAQDTLDMANRILDIARRRYQEGKSPRMDVLSAGIQQASSEQALTTARTALKQSQASIIPLLGQDPSIGVEAIGSLELPPVRLIYATLLEQARGNPKILGAVLELEQNRTQVRLTRVQNMPTPSLFYTYDLSIHQHSVGGAISIPFDLGQNRNAVRQQLETVCEKEAALNGVRLNVWSTLKNAYETYLGAAENAEAFRAKVLEPSEEMVRVAELGFSHGALPFLNLVTAQQAMKSARAQYLGLLLSGHQALNTLEATTGTLVDGDRR